MQPRRDTMDRISHADSVVALLGKLDPDKLPPDERIAVARLQVEAVEEWLAAYLDAVVERRDVEDTPRPAHMH